MCLSYWWCTKWIHYLHLQYKSIWLGGSYTFFCTEKLTTQSWCVNCVVSSFWCVNFVVSENYDVFPLLMMHKINELFAIAISQYNYGAHRHFPTKICVTLSSDVLILDLPIIAMCFPYWGCTHLFDYLLLHLSYTMGIELCSPIIYKFRPLHHFI